MSDNGGLFLNWNTGNATQVEIIDYHKKRNNIMTALKNIHPGEVISDEFLIPNYITVYNLAKDIGIPQTRISQIIKGNRRITADTTLRLANIFVIQQNFGLDFKTILISKKEKKIK